jgi:hypothetical protein
MSTRDLVNAIAAGDALEIESSFNSVMAEKLSDRIGELRSSIAQNMFANPQEDIVTEE